MGTSGVNKYFDSYESIKGVYEKINSIVNESNVYLVKANSIPNFIKLISETLYKLYHSNEKEIKDSEDKLRKNKKYELEKDIVLYSSFEECKSIIKNDDENNAFIIVDEKFLKNMGIYDNNKDKNVYMTINNKNKESPIYEIKFKDFNNNIPFKIKDNGIYKFVYKITDNDKKKNSEIYSLLQCLSNNEKLKSDFLSNKNKFSSIQKNDTKYKISKELYDIINNSSDSLNINDFIQIIGDNKDLYKAKNLIIYLYEQIHSELNEKDINTKFDLIESDPTCIENEYYNFIGDFDIKNKSIISDIFYFENIKSKKCMTCEKEELFKFEMKNSLTFNLEQIESILKNNKLNIMDAFNYYYSYNTNIEIEKINCNICKKERNFEKKYNFNSLPEILTIILEYGNINNIEFSIDYNIDLNNYLYNWNNNKRDDKTKYELISMLKYVKEDNNKLCFGYCKLETNNKWYEYNIEGVKCLSDINESEKGFPYILFYQKIKK